jgi:predicted nucleic acid-binding protein
LSDYVVDASVAIKWFVLEQDSDRADGLSASGSRLYAPSLISTEVASAFCRKALSGLMTSGEARHYLRALAGFFDDIVAVDDLLEPALHNAYELRHPIFDLIYLELAVRLGATFVTADRRFASKAAGTRHADHNVLLSDLQAA